MVFSVNKQLVLHNFHRESILNKYDHSAPFPAWYNSCGTEKCPLAVNGTHWQEQSLESILYGNMQSGNVVNNAVTMLFTKPLAP